MTKIVYVGLFPPENPSVGDHSQALAIQKWFRDYFPDLKVQRFYRRFGVPAPPEGLKDWTGLLATVEKDDIIFIHSSGDFGTLFFWTHMQGKSWHDFRRRLISTFPDNMIVQLPVTVFYHHTEAGMATLRQDHAFYKDYSNVVLMCREPESYGILQRNLSCKSMFVPDFAFYLKPKLKEAESERIGALLSLRHDHESLFGYPQINHAAHTHVRWLIAQEVPNIHIRDVNQARRGVTDGNREAVVNDVLEIYRKFRVVVTDRLHGMVFSILTQTPCVVLQDKIPHKSSGFKDVVSPSTTFVDKVADIPNAIKEVLSKPYEPTDLTEHFTTLKEKVF